MPELTDYRKKPIPETSFYVYDDLRAWQKGLPDHIYRYDTLAEAIKKFKELPDHMTSALGISYQEIHEVDMVHTNRGEPFLVSDYLCVDFVKEIPDYELYLNSVIQEFYLHWKSEHALFGSHLSGVLIPIDEGLTDESYMKNRILRPKDEKFPFSAITEFFNEGVGWQTFSDIANAAKIIYGNTEEYRKPRISKLAVDYTYTDPVSGRTSFGNMDMDIAGYRLFLEKTLQKSKTGIEQQIEAAHIKHTDNSKEKFSKESNEKRKGEVKHER